MDGIMGGRYRLVREIGTGRRGRIFQAVDTQTGQTVAARIVTAGGDVDPEALVRFQKEGAALSTLRHPNLVQVYGTFLDEHTGYTIMELVDGPSLSDMLCDGQPPLRWVRQVMEQVASALAYLHGQNIVHQRVTASNIIVAAGHVKVSDFGVGPTLYAADWNMATREMSIGTPLYMAPEQIEGRMVDGRADIYSFGAVLYQMVTGRPPFEDEDPLTVAFKHVHKASQPPSEVNADVPEDWEAVILKALAKDPADRFQTADAMLDAIRGLSVGAPAPRFCPSCGKTVAITARFCGRCGEPVADIPPPVEQPARPSALPLTMPPIPAAAPPVQSFPDQVYPGVSPAQPAPRRSPRKRTIGIIGRIRRRL